MRRFEAEQARTRELTEALEQQTATSETLVISNSLSDTQAGVRRTSVQSGLKLFPGALVSVALRYGATINAAAVARAGSRICVEAWRRQFPRTPSLVVACIGAALLASAESWTFPTWRVPVEPVRRGPKLPDQRQPRDHDHAHGCAAMRRSAAASCGSCPGALSDKQIAVLKTFASQAVIPIEYTWSSYELRRVRLSCSSSRRPQPRCSGAISRSQVRPAAAVLDTLVTSAADLGDGGHPEPTLACPAVRGMELPRRTMVVASAEIGQMRPASLWWAHATSEG